MKKISHLYKKIALIGMCIVFGNALSIAQSSIEKAFVSMPDEYYLSMNSETRGKLLEEYKTDSTNSRKNKFRGASSILRLSPENNFLKVKNSEKGIVELKVLAKTKEENYYALIFTACAPICDSHIGFYNSNWILLQQSLMPTVSITDFLDLEKIKAEGEKPERIGEKFDIIFIQISFSEESNDIIASLNSGKNMDEENYDRLKSYLKGDKLLYTWENGNYKKSKSYWEKIIE